MSYVVSYTSAQRDPEQQHQFAGSFSPKWSASEGKMADRRMSHDTLLWKIVLPGPMHW
jgi:hypothetical protein